MATDAHSLYLEASRHTEPRADLDAAWDYAVSADDPMMAIAFDTETTDVTWGVPQIYTMHPNTISPVTVHSEKAPIVFGISACVPGPDRLYLCWGRLGTPMFEWLAGRLGQPGYKVAHNLRFDLRVCRAQGMEIGGPSDDTLTMGRIIWDRKKKFDLQTLAEMLCPEVSDWCTPVKKELTKLKREATAWAKYQRALRSPTAKNTKRAITAGEELATDCQKTPPNYADVPDEIMGPYSMTDSFLCWLLNARLRPDIDAVFAGLYDRERLVLERVIDIENQGIPFDWRLAKQEALTLRAQSAKLKDKLVVAAGGPINPNAPGQVLNALKSLGVPMKRLQKKGAPSTDQQLLNRLLAVYDDEVPDEGKTFIEDLLRYRATSKIQSTYLRPLATRAQQADGTIYCSVNPTNTRTGRMSSSGPNFQNIPKAKDNDDELGSSVKRCVMCPPGWRFWYFDYKAMEFAVFGLMAGEQTILDAYAAGEDLHLAMSKVLFGEELAAEKRAIAKTIDFAIIYGAGNGRIAEQLSVPVKEAAAHRETYYSQFPAIPRFIKQCDRELRRRGYVEDYFGRRYHIREGYKAVNALVQGGCAQAFKIAMLNMPQRYVTGGRCKLMLPVHDEMQFRRMQASQSSDRLFVSRVVSAMQNIPQFTSRGLTLRVDVAYSDTSWAEKRK